MSYCKLVLNNAWSDDGYIVAQGSNEEIKLVWFKWISGNLTKDEKLIAKMHGPKLHMIEYKNDVRVSRTTVSLSGFKWFETKVLRNN